MRLRLPYIMLFTVLLSLSSAAWACPLCSESLPSQTATGTDAASGTGTPATAEGFAWSIYLMIAIPYGMVLSVGGYIYYLTRTRRPRTLPSATS